MAGRRLATAMRYCQQTGPCPGLRNSLQAMVLVGSDKPAASRPAPHGLSAVAVLVLMATAAAAVGWARARMLSRFHATREAARSSEPAPWLLSADHTQVFSLGYRDAAADYLFATTLVQYGQSFETKSRFELAGQALETITQLAPNFPQPYLYADTLLTLQAQPARHEDFRKALELHKRGTAALPLNSELWLVAGQFAAYLAPYELPEAERPAVRQHGARLLARACELVSHNENIPYNCIGAASLLDRAGEREAMIRFARRTLAVNDDPAIRLRALAFLERALGERERQRQHRRIQAIEAIWQAQLPMASRTLMSVFGPIPDPYACLGTLDRGLTCAADWPTWERAFAANPPLGEGG